MREIVWTLQAQVQLQQIYELFENLTPESGERFLEEVDEVLDLLKDFPTLCRTYVPPFRRKLVHDGSYGIFYVPQDRGIVVHAIEDLRQDPERIRRNLGIR